jgi:uncharacterized protein YneF (UPF0154 family)
MGFMFAKEDLESVIKCQPEAIEKMVKALMRQMENYETHLY